MARTPAGGPNAGWSPPKSDDREETPHQLTEPDRAARGGDDATRAPWERFTDEYGESVLDPRAALHGVLPATGEVVRVGREQQREQPVQVLDRARRALYRILADRD